MKLTKKVVESLPATGTRYEVRDETVTGFLVRVGVTGEKTFYLMYRAGKGRGATKRRLALGAFPDVSVEQARSLARARLAQVTMGEDPAAMLKEAKGTRTVHSVLEQFLAEHVRPRLKPGTIRTYEQQAAAIVLPALGKMKITDVQPRHIGKLHHQMRATPYQANRVISLLSKFFNWCEVTGFRERGSNPTFGLERYKEQKRATFMGKQELEAIGSAIAALETRGELSPIMSAVFKVLLFTGARSGEITTLKWEYLDISQGLAHLPDSKTGAKTVHLPVAARTVLESLPRINEYCFPGRYERGHIVNIKNAWQRILTHAGLSGWRIHDLRHAFASYAVNSGQGLPIIGKMLGHTQAATTQRYAHVADNPVAIAAEETARQIQKDLSGGRVLPFRKAAG